MKMTVFVVLQVGNLGLLFMLLFFIYAALGVELFGELGKKTSVLFVYTKNWTLTVECILYPCCFSVCCDVTAL